MKQNSDNVEHRVTDQVIYYIIIIKRMCRHRGSIVVVKSRFLKQAYMKCVFN